MIDIYAEIIVNSDAAVIDKPFTYKVHETIYDQIKVGHRVKVSFGQGKRMIEGFVIGLKCDDVDLSIKYKTVKELMDEEPILTPNDLKIIEFMREKYLCKYIDAIRVLIPTGLTKGQTNKTKSVIVFKKDLDDGIKNKDGFQELIHFVKENNGLYTKSDLSKRMKFSIYRINKLVELGVFEVEEIVDYRYNMRCYDMYKRANLTDEQKEAISFIEGSSNNITLLKGATGSGKTEVYLSLMESTLNQGRGAILLVPEISLTPQMIERVKGRFGEDVALFHSKLSEGERFDEWYRVKEGKAKIVVGARSAIFLPVHNLGLILIDEEHENSYKSEFSPKYNTIEVGEFLSSIKCCKVVLGSATPSVESYYKAKKGIYGFVEMKNRVMNKPLPEMKVIDMRKELKEGNISVFSRDLRKGIENRLTSGEQVILFLNRRGFSTFVSCRSCGFVFKCPHCDISLTYHKGGFLRCHYCGSAFKQPKTCPKCSSKYVKFFGSGTQKIEDEVHAIFPKARVLRMDVDTTREKNAHENIYNSFKNGNYDILIGTQMVTKGLDFPNVTLVGVLAADISLNIPDFRAEEKTFQILTQVGGRAGRGDKQGEVIIQTYNPENKSILYSKEGSYEKLYEREIELRKLMNYPPFSKILIITGISKNEEILRKEMAHLRQDIEKIIENKYDISGPSPCIITKIQDKFRYQIMIKGSLESEYLLKIKENVLEKVGILNKKKYNDIKIGLDINPTTIA